jgi:hypothetical protein
VGAGAALLAVLSGCFGDGTADRPPPGKAASARECAARQEAIPVERLDPGAAGWAFGKPPVYVSFLDTPIYRAARRGPGSFVAIYRGTGRNGHYGVKLGTLVHPTFVGEVRQEVSAVTTGRKAAFSLGSRSTLEIDRLPTTRTLNVTRRDDRIPGGLRFTGPGCYRLTLEAQGQRYELAFPVRFRRAE